MAQLLLAAMLAANVLFKYLTRLKTDQTNEPLFAPVFLFLSLCQLKKLQHDYK